MNGLGKRQANSSAVSCPVEPRTDALCVVEVPEATDAPEGPPAASDGVAVFPALHGPGRPRGYAKTGGRKKGSKNRRTLEVEEALRPLLPAAKRKLKALMASEDDKVAYSAVMGVFAYIYGRPIDRKEVSGADGAPLIDAVQVEYLTTTEAARLILATLREAKEAAHRQIDKMDTTTTDAGPGVDPGPAGPSRYARQCGM